MSLCPQILMSGTGDNLLPAASYNAFMTLAAAISVAQIVPCTEAEGPGRRFALWFQGCPLRCPGCCNPEMLPFAGGTPMPLGEVVKHLGAAREQHGIEGVTLLGGEPFAHAVVAAPLAQAAQTLDLS